MDDERIEAVTDEIEEPIEEELEVEEDDELEYDDDGNIVIDGDDDLNDEENVAEDEADEEEIPEEDAKEREIKSLTERLKRYEALEAQAKDTLSKLGVTDEDTIAGLVKLAAETEDKTSEEYVKARTETERLEAAKKLLAKQEFDNLKRADLEALKPHCPELRDLDDLEKMENFTEFAKFRDMGLTPVQAYSAANPGGIRKNAAEAGKRSARNDSKAHLHSNVPRSSGPAGVKISREEMAMLKSALGEDKSDKEIYEIYKKITK